MNHPGVRKFDRLSEIYDATRGGEERGRYHARELSQLLRKEDLVLEIGIGTGLVALALSEIGFNVVGIDISRLLAIHLAGVQSRGGRPDRRRALPAISG